MIYSITQFGGIPGELELLKLRLTEEVDYIDRFIVVESSRTHAGVPKTYQLKSESAILNSPKVLCMFISAPICKHRQQYYDIQAAAAMSIVKPEDIVIYSDLDEVNDRRDMPKILDAIRTYEYIHLSLYNHQYFMNYFGNGWQYRWTLGFGCTGGYFLKRRKRVFDLRFEWNPAITYTPPVTYLETTGHHFSYMLTPDQIVNKIRNTSDECFDKPEYRDINYIRQAIAEGHDVLGRRRNVWHTESIDDRYPISLRTNLGAYTKWIKEL